jgi:hypothetical protein
MIIIMCNPHLNQVYKRKKLVCEQQQKNAAENRIVIAKKNVTTTGLEPARCFQHYHLKVACLPISTRGQMIYRIAKINFLMNIFCIQNLCNLLIFIISDQKNSLDRNPGSESMQVVNKY